MFAQIDFRVGATAELLRQAGNCQAAVTLYLHFFGLLLGFDHVTRVQETRRFCALIGRVDDQFG